MSLGIYKQSARDIMSRQVAVIHESVTVHDALLLMAENGVSALPVVDDAAKCVGMLSQSDIIDLARDLDMEDEEISTSRNILRMLSSGLPMHELTGQRINDCMSFNLVCASADELVTTIADKMLAEEIHHLPIIDDQGDLLGIVSTMDILRGLRTPIGAK